MVREEAAPAWRRPEAIAFAIVAMLAAITITAIARHGSVFDDYSARFGELAPGEFESLNAEMRCWSRVARGALLALAPADLALLLLSVRAWRSRPSLAPKVAFFAGLLVAVALALMLLIALAVPHGGGMIGSPPSLSDPRSETA